MQVAAWSERPVVETVAVFDLQLDLTHIDMIWYYASVIAGLRRCLHSLRDFYRTLHPLEQPIVIFPYITSFKIRTKETTTEVQFDYIDQINEKRVFGIRTEHGDSLIIKICPRSSYGIEGHKLAANLGIAPPLVTVNHVLDWMVVVMPDLRATHECLWDLKKAAPMEGLEYHQSAQPYVDALTQKVVDGLHSQMYVHGDIRDTNVLIPRHDNPNPSTAFLIDWEWSGVAGTVLYPHGVADDDPRVPRPSGAFEGQSITQEHDMAMLRRLLDPIPVVEYHIEVNM